MTPDFDDIAQSQVDDDITAKTRLAAQVAATYWNELKAAGLPDPDATDLTTAFIQSMQPDED